VSSIRFTISIHTRSSSVGIKSSSFKSIKSLTHAVRRIHITPHTEILTETSLFTSRTSLVSKLVHGSKRPTRFRTTEASRVIVSISPLTISTTETTNVTISTTSTSVGTSRSSGPHAFSRAFYKSVNLSSITAIKVLHTLPITISVTGTFQDTTVSAGLLLNSIQRSLFPDTISSTSTGINNLFPVTKLIADGFLLSERTHLLHDITYKTIT
jgi:hypothetical protein